MSAAMAGAAASGSAGGVPADPVRALQRALYRAAKADPGRRFHALHDKILRRDVLWRAWVMVRGNNGAPGIDKITLAAVGEYGVTRLPGELASELGEGRYRPVPARRVYIPKPGVRDEQRPLSIPSVRDRIVQAAVKIALGPVFEADFLPASFGFRPGRPAHDALQVLIDESRQGRRWVAETDIANCFSAMPGTSVTGTRLSCSARSGITPWNGSRCGCPRKATGGEPGDGASNRCCCPRTTWA